MLFRIQLYIYRRVFSFDVLIVRKTLAFANYFVAVFLFLIDGYSFQFFVAKILF